MKNLKENLKEFGKVLKCEETNGKFHILITEGFKTNLSNTLICTRVITKALKDKYSLIVKLSTNNNHFECILKPENKKS